MSSQKLELNELNSSNNTKTNTTEVENKDSGSNDTNNIEISKSENLTTKQRLDRFLHGADSPPPMTLEFKNVCARVPVAPGSNDKKLVLNNISGIFKPGECMYVKYKMFCEWQNQSF